MKDRRMNTDDNVAISGLPQDPGQAEMRQVVLNIETTGLERANGHRIIEIAVLEIVNHRITGKHVHWYVNPNRDIDPSAQAVHGISRQFLQDKPAFSDIAQDFIGFIKGADLIAHNASFDVAFVNGELAVLRSTPIESITSSIVDTLTIARDLRPGKRNSLAALCDEYKIERPDTNLQGALLDAHMLAATYLAMTRD
jgi:DNA polymerase-3 subunit epsilon